MKVKYCCDKKSYEDYYSKQAGNGIPGFQGSKYQKGSGLGSMFSGLLRYAAPLLKKGAIAVGKYLGEKALNKGSSLVQDLVRPKGIKRPAPKRRSVSRRVASKRRRRTVFE